MLKGSLYNHQTIALHLMKDHEAFALFMEQGVGKTLPTLCRIADLYHDGLIQDALIVAPKATMGAWFRDMEHFKPEIQDILKSIVTVINYDSVWRTGKGYNRPWGCIVLDESHKIKNRASKRSAFLLKLALKSDYRYILTGTPVGNGQLENIWSQYAFLYPTVNRGKVSSQIFGTYSKFTDRYCILNQYWQPSQYINVSELQDIIGQYSYRVTKAECLDLPDKLPEEFFDITNKEPKIYKELSKSNTVAEWDILCENPLSLMSKLRQVCSGFIFDQDKNLHELKTEKLDALKDFLEDWTKKLVIFCDFKYSVKSVSDLLTKLKIKHVILDGDQKDKNIWRTFQTDDSVQVIICQYQSASQGIDLYAADTIIFYEPTLSSTIYEQAKDRIHRIGQTSKCSYINFVVTGSIEEMIYKALKNYSDFGEKLFTEYITRYVKSYAK